MAEEQIPLDPITGVGMEVRPEPEHATAPAKTPPQVSVEEFRQLQAELAEMKKLREAFEATQNALKEQQERWGAVQQAMNPQTGTPQNNANDPNVQWWNNPAEMAQRQQAALLEQWRQEQAHREAQASFWRDFYDEHQDLATSRGRREVQLTLQASPELQGLPLTVESAKRLADATRERLIAIARDFYPGGEPNRPGLNIVERSGQGRRRPSNTPEEPQVQPLSISDALAKAQQQLRRA